jgi:hypothetical protein
MISTAAAISIVLLSSAGRLVSAIEVVASHECWVQAYQ